MFQVAYISACAFHIEKNQVSVKCYSDRWAQFKKREQGLIDDAALHLFAPKSNISSAKTLVRM